MAFKDEIAEKFGNISGDEWLALSQGLGQGRNWQEGLAAGIGGVRQARINQAAATRQSALDKAKAMQDASTLRLQAAQAAGLEKTAERDKFSKAGPGLMFNEDTQEYFPADPAMLAKIKAAAASGKSSEFLVKEPVYAGGKMYYPVANKATGGIVYQGTDGSTLKSLEGARRAQDSMTGDLGGIQSRAYGKMGEEATASMGMERDLRQYQRLLTDNPDFRTGAGAGLMQTARKWMMAVGIADEDTIANATTGDQLNNLTMNFVMERIKGTKGSISEKEMEAFAKSVPNLGNTTEGNQELLKMLITIEARKQEMFEYISERVNDGGSLYDAKKDWKEYAKEHDALSDVNYDTITAMGGAGGTESIDDIMNLYK